MPEWHGRVGRPLRQVDDKLEVECLYRRANTLWLCDAGLLSGFQVGRSEDGGHSFEPFLHFSQVTGPRSCADTSPVARQCGSIWEDRREELTLFGPQPGTVYLTNIPAEAQTDDGCAIAGITTASGSWMWLALLAAWVRGRHRRRGLQLDPRSAGTYVDSSAA